MPRNSDIPRADTQHLYRPGQRKIKLNSRRWFEWLREEETRSFAFEGYNGYFTARKEVKKRGGAYWYAYRWIDGKTTKVYLGASSNLTGEKLERIATRLSSGQLALPV